MDCKKAIEIWPSYLPEEDNEEEDVSEATLFDTPSHNAGNFSHDYTRFSLDDGPATSKRQFVLDLVKAYMNKYPESTYDQLKNVFSDDLCTNGHRHIGLLCTEAEHKAWDNKYKDKRYSVGYKDGTRRSADGINFYVNTQWSLNGMEGILKLAKANGFNVRTISKQN